MAAAGTEAVPKGELVDSEHSPPYRINDPEKGESTQDATDEESGTPSPGPVVLPRWNDTKMDMFRFFSTMYSFILMGMTDGALGVCCPGPRAGI